MSDAQFWTRYRAYMKSPEWKAKRAQVRFRSGGFCEQCRTAKAAHVHHVTYANLGNEPLIDLLHLCKACHQRCHPNRKFGTGSAMFAKARKRRKPRKAREPPRKPREPTNEKISTLASI